MCKKSKGDEKKKRFERKFKTDQVVIGVKMECNSLIYTTGKVKIENSLETIIRKVRSLTRTKFFPDQVFALEDQAKALAYHDKLHQEMQK